ncbi:hypothetical protein [Candidatus Solirubrobacter pratensis]|uniref:hypothetical protein n=1 Tax=Candidatus Solirubrobacter pratensis TaxID=1298857 RepID=UPI0003FCEAE5|nr:hypothetical protein [Candidatus Solirubrobacter pratensis]
MTRILPILAALVIADAAKVTAALRALISERLDSLVSDGWLTTAQRDARLACFDGAPSCKGGAGPAWRSSGCGDHAHRTARGVVKLAEPLRSRG